jgi:(p)ppGpp synthase/HD superfamily hydrolase
MADSLARLRLQRPEVQLVKLADRITNLQPPPRPLEPGQAVAYREEAGRILAALGSASESLAERLRAKIDAYGAYL